MAGKGRRKSEIKYIPIDRIHILNPRVRNLKVFHEIATNMTEVGLKRPITVTPCQSAATGKDYDLICGQGRLEAFIGCGESHIWAHVIDASEEQALIMSLVENLARRQHRPVDLLQGIEVLSKRGYDAKTIAKKTGLTPTHVSEILNLMERGEERLLAAVEAGNLPMYLAIKIAENPEDEQRALHEAYQSKELRGNRLLAAKKLMDQRRRYGKGLVRESRDRKDTRRPMTGSDVVRAFERETDRKKLLIRKANAASDRLVFITEAMRVLLHDENFNNLLRAEGLQTLPRGIVERMNGRHGQR